MIRLRKFKMKGKDRYKLIVFGRIYCWDFRWYCRLIKGRKAPEATLEQLRDKKWLEDRLPTLIEEFKKDIEELGFIY